MTQEKQADDCMRSLLFFDDWMLHTREGLDRRQGQPQWVKQIVTESHPDLRWIRAVHMHHERERNRYVMVLDCGAKTGKRFWTRVETENPYDWPEQRWAPGGGPIWTRAENAYRDQHGDTLDLFELFCLEGTPLADRGLVMTLVDYRCTHRGGPDHSAKPSACVAFSPDGLHFEVQKDTFWMPHHSDADNTPFYNPWTGEYLITCRSEQTDRRICVVTTRDFKTFSPAAVVLQPDPQDPVGREFYGLQPVLYDDVFVGMLNVFDAEPTEKIRWKCQGTHEMQLAYSYNGHNWYRAFREAFIGRTAPGTPTGGLIWAFPPVRTPDDRLLFGATGIPEDHNPEVPEKEAWSTHLYEMRLDGFAYLRTRARHGLIRTKAVVPRGGDLTVNARLAPSGHVKVAVLDSVFKPLPHYTIDDAVPVTGDELFAKVRWRERDNLDELKDQSVILEVHVREGELYALRFGHGVHLGEYPRNRV